MKTTLIILGIVFVVKYLIKELSKPDFAKVGNKEDNLEQGFPNSKMQSLHIDSTKEQPELYPNIHNESPVKSIEDFYENDPHKQVYTKNMFVESYHELGLSLFERNLTVKMVNDAYEKVLDDHMDKIRRGIPEVFDINEKKAARDYLIGKLIS